MIPSTDTRLVSMIDAMTGVIIPALDSGNAFAREQAALVVGHLQALRAQQPVADEFERLDHNRSRALADELLAHADGGAEVARAAKQLRGRLEGPAPFTMEQLRRAQDVLTSSICDLITAGGVDGTEEFVAASTRTVLDHERRHALRLRSFFSMMGYEDGSVPVPTLDEMMAEFRAAHGAEQSRSGE